MRWTAWHSVGAFVAGFILVVNCASGDKVAGTVAANSVDASGTGGMTGVGGAKNASASGGGTTSNATSNNAQSGVGPSGSSANAGSSGAIGSSGVASGSGVSSGSGGPPPVCDPKACDAGMQMCLGSPPCCCCTLGNSTMCGPKALCAMFKGTCM